MPIDRIHDRVSRPQDENYWKVSATTETKKEKKRDEGDRQQRQQDSFGETSDFTQLLSKDPRNYRRKKLERSQIAAYVFRGVSTDRNQATLELDIQLQDGSLLQGAQLALSREVGMKLVGRKAGETLDMDSLLPSDPYVTVGLKVPQEPAASAAAPAEAQPPASAPRIEWYYYLGIAVGLFALLALVYLFLTV